MSAGRTGPERPASAASDAANAGDAAAADTQLLSRILEEYLAALEQGERPDREVLLARYPAARDC